MMLEDSQEVRARAQVSWYKTSDTSLLPLNSLKPFLEMYEVGGDVLVEYFLNYLLFRSE